MFFAVFSGTANELMVPAFPPNTHPRPHLMQKETTDFLNLPRRGTILGVQNVALYCKIDTVIQLFRWLYKWSLAQRLYKTLVPLFLFRIEPEISTPEKSTFYFRATLGVKEVLQSSKNSISIVLIIFDSILLPHSKKSVL